MKITVKITGDFQSVALRFRQGAAAYDSVVHAELQRWGQEMLERLKADIRSNAFDLPPKQDASKPPLIDTGAYVESWTAQAEGNELAFFPAGQNRHMSNDALSDLLEYGAGQQPPRPHVRPWAAQMEKQLPELAKRIVNGVLGDY